MHFITLPCHHQHYLSKKCEHVVTIKRKCMKHCISLWVRMLLKMSCIKFIRMHQQILMSFSWKKNVLHYTKRKASPQVFVVSAKLQNFEPYQSKLYSRPMSVSCNLRNLIKWYILSLFGLFFGKYSYQNL